MFRTVKTDAPMTVATKFDDESDVGDGRSASNSRIWTTPPRMAGSVTPAWFANEPYQGMRPRNSRISVVPIAATHPATAGPPSDIAATIGAIATPCWDPWGKRTGRAEATSVRTIQKAIPTKTSDLLVATRIRAEAVQLRLLGGKARVAASSATALRVTTPMMYAFRASACTASYVSSDYRTLPSPASVHGNRSKRTRSLEATLHPRTRSSRRWRPRP